MKIYTLGYVLIIICFIFTSLFLPLVSDAAVTVETGVLNPDGTPWPSQPIAQFTARYGNNAIGGTWELSHNWNGGPAQDTKHYIWANGVNVPFTFTHNSLTGTTTLTLAGGTSTTWNFTPPFSTRIWILARSDAANHTIRIVNLSFNGTPVGAAIFAQNTRRYMMIQSDQLADYHNFTLTGTINFSWIGIATPPQMQAIFAIKEYTPPPPVYPPIRPSTGANENMITLLIILAVTGGILILRRNRWFKKS